MKAKISILFVLASILFVTAGCRHPEVDRYAKGQDVVTKERPLGKWTDCRICEGKGTCIHCNGTGKVDDGKCNVCKGSGRCNTCEGQGGFRSGK